MCLTLFFLDLVSLFPFMKAIHPGALILAFEKCRFSNLFFSLQVSAFLLLSACDPGLLFVHTVSLANCKPIQLSSPQGFTLSSKGKNFVRPVTSVPVVLSCAFLVGDLTPQDFPAFASWRFLLIRICPLGRFLESPKRIATPMFALFFFFRKSEEKFRLFVCRYTRTWSTETLITARPS